MPWTAPATRTVGQILTAAFENTQIRDNQLAIDALLDLATGSFTDGGALHGSGTGTITALAVLADGRIHVGDGATDPAVYHLLTGSAGVVRTEAGGLEFNASAIAAGGIVKGDGAGIFEILALGAANLYMKVNGAGTDLEYGAGTDESGQIVFFEDSCPSGWTEYTAARGRYIVGTPSGGTDQGTQGTALTDQEDRAVGQHSHVIGQTSGSASSEGYTGFSTSLASTPDSTENAGAVASTNAPYIQLTVCKKD